MNKDSKVVKRVALSGILLALTVIMLFLASTLPTSRLSFYALSSFFVSFIIIEFGAKYGFFFYFAALILALAVIPDKIGLIPFAIFFGIYGLVKFYIEKLNRIIVEYILKVVFFNICLAIGIIFIKEFFLGSISIKVPLWAIIAALEIAFIVYDCVYSLIIQYYKSRIRKSIGM
ncbi:MAG: hypothetical protein ACOX7R_10015 [Acetivibrionales bacterium]